MRVDFLDAVRAHWARYPLMEPQDFAKLACQSEFGPAHMAESPDRVLAALLAERKEAGPDPLPPEPIGNGLCRFHITQSLSTLSELPLPSPSPACRTIWRTGGGKAVPRSATAKPSGRPTVPTTG